MTIKNPNKIKSIILFLSSCLILVSTLTGCIKQTRSHTLSANKKHVIEKQKFNHQNLPDFDLRKFIAGLELKQEYLEQKEQLSYDEQCIKDIRNNTNHYKDLIFEAKNIQKMIDTLQETKDSEKANKILIDQINRSFPALFNLSQKNYPKPDCQTTQEKTIEKTYEPEENPLETDTLIDIKIENLSIKSLFNKIRKDFAEQNFEEVVKAYEEIEGQLEETDIPYKIRYYYGISLYENDEEDAALEKLKEMQKEPALADILSIYLELGKWYIKNNKLDEAADAYKNTVYNILDLEELKEKAQKELTFIEKITTPLEKQLFTLIQKAEDDIDEKNLDEARKNCLNAIKIMTSNSLYNYEYYDRCDNIFSIIREREFETVTITINTSLNLADQERQFQSAKEPLQNYLAEHPDTDYEAEINSAISEIDKLEEVYSNEKCVFKIEKFKQKYNNECLPKIVQMDYEYALSCLENLIKESDAECFTSISEIDQIKEEATKKIESLQSVYLKNQLEKAATLFARARQSTTKNKKKENLVKSFFLLKKLTAQFPEGRFQKKISRYATIVEKEIQEKFPELLASE